ncbi:hypothetical protein F5880DRAFT_1479747, partial [Lentinula raphanica]
MVTWLQSYLNLTESRAEWAYVADALIAENVPACETSLDEWSRINIFLQSWKTAKKDLPKDIRDMLKVAKKNNLRLEGIAFSRDIVRSMPIWLHTKVENVRKTHNSKECRCLREKHKVSTVGDAEQLAKVTRFQNHKRRSNCRCGECKKAREEHGCTAPFKCMTKAMDLIRALPPKWNPLSKLPEDFEPEELPKTDDKNSEFFDWRISTKGTLADAFRIFTEGAEVHEIPTTQWDPNPDSPEIEVYTDGSCQNTTEEGPQAGAGIHFPDENIPDRSIKIPSSLKQTNQTGEIIGIKEAAATVDPAQNL